MTIYLDRCKVSDFQTKKSYQIGSLSGHSYAFLVIFMAMIIGESSLFQYGFVRQIFAQGKIWWRFY
jgi:hypothetical protein